MFKKWKVEGKETDWIPREVPGHQGPLIISFPFSCHLCCFPNLLSDLALPIPQICLTTTLLLPAYAPKCREILKLQCYFPVWAVLGRPTSASAWQHPCVQSEVHKDMIWWVWCVMTWLAYTEPWPQPHPIHLGWTGLLAVNQALLL